MTTGKREAARRNRVWPGIAFPVCLTLLLVVAAWFFVAKVAGDQDRADAAALRLEGYARLEAREIAGLAAEHAKNFVSLRLGERANQEKNLRLEVRGVMDAVYRLLTAGLEKSRKNTTARREVGHFPPGFEGVRSYLEISPLGPQGDEALEALRSFATELAALLPAGCSLAVVEDSSRELLSLGGGVPPEAAVSEAIVREFIFDDGGRSRHWTLRVEIHAPDAHPAPTPEETAAVVSEKLGHIRLDKVVWRGWLVDSDGTPLAAFPPTAGTQGSRSTGDLPPYIDMPGEWLEVDSQRLVWLEPFMDAVKMDLPWIPSVAVAIARPPPPLDLASELVKDGRWSAALVILAVLALAGWMWFVKSCFFSKKGMGLEQESVEETPQETKIQRRLVRDASLSRAIPEVQGVIVADIGADGSVNLNAPDSAPVPPKAMPSGSLFRLQGIHRGRVGMAGSRILDQARSPVLRELADRVRPPASLGGESIKVAGEKIAKMKSPTGWKKVEE